MDLLSVARCVYEEAARGEAQIVLWKEGPSWEYEIIHPVDVMYHNDDVKFILECRDVAKLQRITKKDPRAIAVNGHRENLGVEWDELYDRPTGRQKDLTDALRECYRYMYGTASDMLENSAEELMD